MKNQKILYIGASLICVGLLAVFYLLAPAGADRPEVGKDYNVLETDLFDQGGKNYDPLAEGDEYLSLLEQVNPHTGKNYTEDQLRRIKFLHKKFPENELVPRPLSSEEIQSRKDRELELKTIARQMVAGTVTLEQIHEYYNAKEQVLKDRIQLVRYVLDEEKWPLEVQKKYENILKHAEKVVKRLGESREQSLRIQKAKTAKSQ